MKLIQSFWSKPFLSTLNKRPLTRGKGGWVTAKSFYMAWALSVLQLKKLYGNYEIVLVTDSSGKELLIDKFGLPYDRVILELDCLNNFSERLWALGKMKAYSIQKEPFIHIDGDAFLWGKILEPLFHSELCVQNIDNRTMYYSETAKNVMEHFKNIPSSLLSHLKCEEIFGINAGIIGGNNIDFFEEYTSFAMKLINRNQASLRYINQEYFNMFYEQFLFSFIQRKNGCKMDTLLSNLSQDFNEIVDMSLVPIKPYNHIVGHAKSSLIINEQVCLRLLIGYPNYYNRINKGLE